MACKPARRRDFSSLRERRLRAARLFAAGQLPLAAIARQLQVSRQSVTRWHAQWKQGGSGALHGAGRAGRKPRLSGVAWRRLRSALLRGPRACGFPADSWTLPRVGELIHQTTGVRYHPGHVWKILSAMDWKPCGRRSAGPGGNAHRKRPARRSWLTIKRRLRGRGARSGAAGRSRPIPLVTPSQPSRTP